MQCLRYLSATQRKPVNRTLKMATTIIPRKVKTKVINMYLTKIKILLKAVVTTPKDKYKYILTYSKNAFMKFSGFFFKLGG